MVNPYYCYAVSFLIAIFVYLLGWSDLYPKLSFSVLLFLLATVFIHGSLGFVISRKKNINFNPIKTQNNLVPLSVTTVLYLLWGCEFLYEGGIPLLKILLNQPYNYRLFGIPTLHVFIVTFSSFYTVFLFYIYLSSRRSTVLFLYLINVLAALLIYNRSMFLFNASASFFLFMATKPRVLLYYFLPIIFLVLLYFFGVMGTLRESREARIEYNNALFLDVGKAKKSFVQSPIPNEFFWSYIYISSPLANFQNNINSYPVTPASFKSFLQFVNDEIFMDFISKRINFLTGLEPARDLTIPGPFNVSTIYSKSYCYLGWWGVLIMVIVVLAVPWFYLRCMPSDSPFFASGLAILCTMFLFMAFDNTIRFTGLSFQLVYPFIFHFYIRLFPQSVTFFI